MAKPTATDGLLARVAILYHFMYPDDVVSALHLDGLAQGLAANGWEVEALPCNRGCRDEIRLYSPSDTYRGVQYNRIWRPGFSQKSFAGRLLNSAWMIVAWSRLAFRGRNRRPSVVVIGTDPIFAAMVAIPLRFFAPRIKLVHWCFDIHPEAAVVGGMQDGRLAVRLAKAAMRRAYRCFDLIVDIGVCMRDRLRLYDHGKAECELTPWALIEPDDPIERDLETRRALFGDARIGILYSGNFGQAHDFTGFLTLARALRGNPDIHFCFAMRGNQAKAFKNAVTPEDTNISFAGFASLKELGKRLGSADIHLASLKQEWAGVSVPSKFFGSIASGRPVMYAGPRNSAIGNWIETHKIGWIIDPDNISPTAEQLTALAKNPSDLTEIQNHSHAVYQKYFSRHIVTENWDKELRALL